MMWDDLVDAVCDHLVVNAIDTLEDSVADSNDIEHVLLTEWDNFIANLEWEFGQRVDECKKRIIQESKEE